MHKINITELRRHLPKYLSDVTKGNEILITSHGKVIARILPPVDIRQEAKRRLADLRKICKVGDVVSPTGDFWKAERIYSHRRPAPTTGSRGCSVLSHKSLVAR